MSIHSMLRNNWKVFLLLLLFSFVVTFFTSGFSILYGDYNPWEDINIYYNIGKSIYFDKVPYKDLFDHKGPIIFFIYYVGYLLSPNSFQGMYIIQSLFLFTSLIYVYRTSCLFISKKLSILTPIIFSSLLVNINNYGGSAEEFILTFILISLYYFIKYCKSTQIEHNPKIMSIHGSLMTFTFFLKLNLIVFWFIPIFSILCFLLLKKHYKNLINNLLYLFTAICLTSLIILSYFYFNDAITDFWNAYIVINSKYGTVELINVRFSFEFLSKNPIILLFIILSVISFFFFIPKTKRLFSFALLMTCFIEYICITISYYVLPYYFIIYLTFIPLGITFFLQKTNSFLKRSIYLASLFYCITSIICFFVIVDSKNFYNNSYKDIIRGSDKQHLPLNKMSEYIINSGNQPLLSLGINYGITLFTQTKQIPCVKYFFGPNLVFDIYPELYKEQESYIRNKKTKFVVIDTDGYYYRDFFIRALEESGYKEILRDSVYPGYALYSY